jgi:recF protein
MRICTLKLANFRRFNDFQLECHPKINCIIGENGTGKTSLLEALWLSVAASSFRTHKMGHLIQTEKKEARIELCFETDGVEQSLSFSLKGHDKEIIHNRTKLTLSNLIGLLLAVVISSEDLDLIEGEPSKRRYFLDLMLSQTDPLYLWHMKRYNKGLKAKNQLLKSKHIKPIPFFEEEMAKSGSYISERRSTLAQALSIDALPFLEAISSKSARLRFEMPRWSKEELQARWLKDRNMELRLGSTLSGPHREDLKLFLDEKEAKHFASIGGKKKPRDCPQTGPISIDSKALWLPPLSLGR